MLFTPLVVGILRRFSCSFGFEFHTPMLGMEQVLFPCCLYSELFLLVLGFSSFIPLFLGFQLPFPISRCSEFHPLLLSILISIPLLSIFQVSSRCFGVLKIHLFVLGNLIFCPCSLGSNKITLLLDFQFLSPHSQVSVLCRLVPGTVSVITQYLEFQIPSVVLRFLSSIPSFPEF